MRLSWRWWLLLLWLAAVLLLTHNLGALPLRDWDEALVARVAEEISLRPFPSNLLPTLWGEPYANKPPLLHALIAAAIQLWRGGGAELGVRALPPEWLVRLLPALLSSLIVPLVAAVQWRLRPGDRLAALCSAAVALTLLPLMRHGRLAMLDGSLISAMTLLWWALLSLPRQPGLAQWRRWGRCCCWPGSGAGCCAAVGPADSPSARSGRTGGLALAVALAAGVLVHRWGGDARSAMAATSAAAGDPAGRAGPAAGRRVAAAAPAALAPTGSGAAGGAAVAGPVPSVLQRPVVVGAGGELAGAPTGGLCSASPADGQPG